MTVLVIILSILAFLLLLALLRFGVSVVYGDGGFLVKAHAGPFSLIVYPRKEKSEKAVRKAARKKDKARKKKGKKAKKPAKKMPGGLDTFNVVLKSAKTILGRLRRKLLIKRLTVHVTFAGGDPMNTAMMYGAANIFFGGLMPSIESAFRIKRRDLRSYADFDAEKPLIYVDAAVSMAVWEAVYIFWAIMPVLTMRETVKPEDRKELQRNGKASDK